jgi:predicted AlkP superfamily pyrophosphatase or phosphodiesterase
VRLRRRRLLAVLLAGACLIFSAGQARRPPDPILILVSVDGWRWDYFDRAGTPTLHALAARGVRAMGLIPPFPSKTYPSHYTIVTGLYPAHHGIISNNMWDDTIGERFTMSAPTSKDPRWWGGEPLWSTVVQQGGRAMSMFWPGSEVEIGGVRPTEWRPFDEGFPIEARVTQVLDWLALPERQRPQFITLYFSEVDTAAHAYGPLAPETLEAASKIDSLLGRLVAGIDASGVADRTNLLVVSDHGLSQQALDRKIFIDDYVDMSTINVVDWSPVLQAAPKTGTVDALYTALAGRHPALKVYRREDLPAELHYSGNLRIPPIVALADDGWAITTWDRFEQYKDHPNMKGGEHGYPGSVRAVHGLFIAAGPQFRRGLVVPAFENVHLYELMCRVLGLKPAKNDGDPAVTKGLLVANAGRAFRPAGMRRP